MTADTVRFDGIRSWCAPCVAAIAAIGSFAGTLPATAAPLYGSAGWQLSGPAPAPTKQITSPTRVVPGLIHRIAVFGKDDRVRAPRKFRRIRNGLGLLFNNRTSTACSAFCVAKDVIATAAHCLFKVDSKSGQGLNQFLFARRYQNIRDYVTIAGGPSAAAQHIMTGSMNLSVRPPIDATGDWAFIRLARPVCRNSVIPVRAVSNGALISGARANRIFQLAYHRDFANWRLAYSKPCRIKRDFKRAKWRSIRRDFSHANELILHTCDTGGASSGSPILMDGARGPQVVGINVGTYIQSNALVQNGRVTRRYKANTIANTAVSAAAFATRLAIFRSARILDSYDAIRDLQRELRRHALYLSTIDGIYGPKTYKAIKDFERAKGFTVTGLASEETLRRTRAARTLPPRRRPVVTHSNTSGSDL